jgi:hypothetical protein
MRPSIARFHRLRLTQIANFHFDSFSTDCGKTRSPATPVRTGNGGCRGEIAPKPLRPGDGLFPNWGLRTAPLFFNLTNKTEWNENPIRIK